MFTNLFLNIHDSKLTENDAIYRKIKHMKNRRNSYKKWVGVLLLLVYSQSCNILKKRKQFDKPQITITNHLNDSILISYYKYSYFDIMYNDELIDSCLEHLGNTSLILYDSNLLIRNNLNIKGTSIVQKDEFVKVVLKPNEKLFLGQDFHFNKEIFLKGDLHIQGKKFNINAIQFVNNIQLKRKNYERNFTIDTCVYHLNNMSDSVAIKGLSINVVFKYLPNNVLFEKVATKKKLLWLEYYSKGKIDSFYTFMIFNKKVTKKCN